MRETWYVLENGNVADPNDCTSDEKGVLTHKSGVKVAMRFADCPMSRGVDADAERAKADSAKAESSPELKLDPEPKDMKPEAGKQKYKTRESKAD